MPEKFKSFFSKIITDKRLKIALFSFIVLFSIFIPLKRADAIWGIGDIGLFDLAQTQLDALDFVDSVILRLVIFIFVLIVESEIFIFTAANLLQWAMNLPINIGIGATKNLLVASGWQFTLGLTNLFFILALVIIALAHILGLSTFEMKKALPKLIIIALLVNFSLVFIGMFVDIVNIFQNAILDALGKDLVTLAIQPLITSAKSVAAWFVLIPTTYLITALIPFGNVIAAVAVGSTILTDIVSGGILLKGLFLIIINLLIGTIFLFYFVFFLMRIAMIWILAIFAPLAFFSYILPQTQGVWREWLKTLSEWLTLGIVAIFLTGLGLKLFATTGDNAILDWGGDINTGRGSLPAFIYNYLFLLVYMGIAAYYSIKYTPQMANTLLDYGKGFAGGVRKIATTRTMKRDVWGPAAEQLADTEKWGQRLIGRAKEAEIEGKIGRAMFMRWAGRGAGGLGKAVGTATKPFRPGLIEYAAQQRRTAKPKGWDQMSVADKSNYINALTQDKEKMVLASQMATEGTFAHAGNEFQEQILGIAKGFSKDDRNKALYGKEIGDIYDVIPDGVTLESELDLKATKQDKEELRKKIEGKAKEITANAGLPEDQYTQNLDLAAAVLRIKAMKTADLVKMKKASLTSMAGRLASHEMTSQQIQRIYNTFGRDTIDDIFKGDGGLNDIFENKKQKEGQKLLDQAYRRNPALVHFFANTPAGRAMNWSGLKYMDRNENNKIDFDKFKERLSEEEREREEEKEKEAAVVPKPVSRVKQFEKDILSKLAEQKEIKAQISEHKKELRGVKTAATRIDVENNIKEKEKTLKINQAEIKKLQKSYSEEWKAEKIALTEAAAETEEPKAKLLSEVEKLKALDKAAEKIESDNALFISKLEDREKVSKLTEKEQEAYKQYKEAYNSAFTERKEIKSKLDASEKYANKISLRLKNIRGIENNLEITKKEALTSGNLEKVKNAELAMEHLKQEKTSIEKILATSTPEEMLNKEKGVDIMQERLKEFNQNPLVVQAKRDVRKLKQKIRLTQDKTEKTRLRKDLSSHKERYSSVFEIAPKLEKAYREQKRGLPKTKGALEKLQTQKLTAISNLNLKKSKDLELKIENQEKLADSSRYRLSVLLPGEIDRLMDVVQEEKVKGTVPFIPRPSKTPPSTTTPTTPSDPQSPPPLSSPPPPDEIPPEDLEKIRKEFKTKTERVLKDISSFEELNKALDDLGEIQGSKKLYSTKELKEIIKDIRIGKKTLSHVTREGGLRRVVRKLISLEKKNTR